MGRRPSPRGVHPVETALVAPGELVLDTSFVYSALGTLEPDHEACSEFLQRAAVSGTVIWFNELLEVELHEVAWKVALKERWGSKWETHRADGRARRRAGRLSNGIMAGWRDLRDAFPFVRVDLSEVRGDYPAPMQSWGVGSYDSVHVATAVYADVPSIATRDAGFANVPQRLAQLYAPKSCVRKMREK